MPATENIRSVLSAFRLSNAHDYIYVNNPKCACTTIKTVLWQNEVYQKTGAIEEVRIPRGVENMPFDNTLDAIQPQKPYFCFSIVRNPFVRVLSAFLNKFPNIHSQNRARLQFLGRHGLADDTDVSFEQFVDLICTENPARLNVHWRPQHMLLGPSLLQPLYIGHLERFGDDMPDILRTIFRNPHMALSVSKNASNAGDKLDRFYTPVLENRIRQLYTADFEIFGYSDRLDQTDYIDPRLRAERSLDARIRFSEATLAQWRKKLPQRLISREPAAATGD